MHQVLSTYFYLMLFIAAAVPMNVLAATPGLPFTENFSDTNLQDSTQTTANWDTKAEQLTFGAWQRQFGVLQSGDTASISEDENDAAALALGDVDGDLDVVADNPNEHNRLYLNNGVNPFNGAIGRDLGTESNATFDLAQGDIDGDGDIDVVEGNLGEVNRLLFNRTT